MIERIPTGIPGLDELIEGGIPKGFQILVAGEAGAGKTIFSCQFAYNKAKEGLKTYYMTIEESEKSIIKGMSRFTWGKEFEDFVKSEHIIIERMVPLSIEDITRKVLSAYDKYKFKIFILDTLTAAAMGWKELQDLPKLRRNIFSLIDILRQYEITSLMLSEIEEGSDKIFRYGFEGFLADGVFLLRRFEYAKKLIEFVILKMRYVNHSREINDVEINENGIRIKPKEKGVIIV
ncbi:MAG: ATPase domain-containing protein [Candidatus Aenigmatarchaeota archaeon]